MSLMLPIAIALGTCMALIATFYQFHPASVKHWSHLSFSSHNRDLILYSYFETPEAFQNFEFFMNHAMHAKADFIIMLNGEHIIDIAALERLPNVRIVKRENRCFDLGGFHEILSAEPELTTRYKRFMFMNASLRGPFFPPWADDTCWSDAYWAKLQDTPTGTKLVGMSWNCANGIGYPAHLQSMILAFDRQTLTETLLPRMKCYEDMLSAIRDGETMISTWIRESGGEVYAMENRFVVHAGPDGRNSSAFLDWCIDGPEETEQNFTHWNDVLHSQLYEGTTIHPYETM